MNFFVTTDLRAATVLGQEYVEIAIDLRASG